LARSEFNLILKKDWDYFPHYEKEQGHFVGRQEEKRKVLNWFVRRNTGCFLVSGERGVGKTALVYEALREASKKNKNIVPILITASQLTTSEEINTQKPQTNELKEEIIVNLIRRVFSIFNEKLRRGDIRRNLRNLYRKAVSSKSEIKEAFKLKHEIEKTKTTEQESGLSFSLDANQIKFLLSYLSAILGITVLNLPAIQGEFSINIALGAILISGLPLSFFYHFKHRNKNSDIDGSSTSIEQLYVSDRNINNLTHDLQNLLEDLADKRWKIIFIIDEMDKIENPKFAEEIIKTFKNLFTLSNGLFVFISSYETYEHVEKEKEKRGISYTLYNDKLFVTRPNFSDLEKYIDEIIDEAPRNALQDDSYHVFRNFLCYQAKSDFFELHYRIRDYISSYDDKDRPVLTIPKLSKQEVRQANLQKVIGQIFALNRFSEPSQWYKNNILLKELYGIVESPSGNQEILKLPNDKPYPTLIQTRTLKSCENLLDYLSRLRYIINNKKHTENTPDNKHRITSFAFEWTNDMQDIPQSPDILLDYEKDFLSAFQTFINMVNQIAGLVAYLKDEKLDVELGQDCISEVDIKSLCDIDVQSVYQTKKVYKDKLTKSFPIHVPREELDKQTNELNTHIQQLLSKSATITMSLITEYMDLENYNTSRFENDNNLFAGNMISLREGVLELKAVHDCIFRQPKYIHQILVIQDIPVDFYNQNKELINSNSTHHQIINLNTRSTEYNLEFKRNKNKQIEGFQDIAVFQSFGHIKQVFDFIKDFDQRDFKGEKEDVDELSEVVEKS